MSYLSLIVLQGLAFAGPFDVSSDVSYDSWDAQASWESETSSVAETPAVDDALTMRLLGDELGQEAATFGPVSERGSVLPVALFVGGVCIAGVGWTTRRKILAKVVSSSTPLEVVGRTMLHGSSGLAVINVEAGDGSLRRLLVGMGGDTPTLVADLGTVAQKREATVGEAYDAIARTVDMEAIEPHVVAPPVYDDLEVELDTQPAYVVASGTSVAPVEDPRQERMDAARAVLNEILAERQRATQSTIADEVS